ELNGSLGSIGLSALVKLLGDLHETGVLRITDGGWSGELDFLNGRLIAASLGDSRGIEALNACVLLLSKCQFGFHEGGVDVERNPDLADEELRARLADLLAQQTEQTPPLPPLDLVPKPAAHGAATPDQLVLDRTAVQLLTLIDGQRSVREIVADQP